MDFNIIETLDDYETQQLYDDIIKNIDVISAIDNRFASCGCMKSGITGCFCSLVQTCFKVGGTGDYSYCFNTFNVYADGACSSKRGFSAAFGCADYGTDGYYCYGKPTC